MTALHSAALLWERQPPSIWPAQPFPAVYCAGSQCRECGYRVRFKKGTKRLVFDAC
ncbi:unnamed protein product [Nyctereutes procyonoides]|uniref:(raccoon dog) hypothetical protein n=1 Tax=Nyctereutes procyonoides TaxID=34880 RepID=A0A811Y3X5_NYCPR|nr:unnamed protein product [Nyctereutes procyonoides]